jgi:hypothetical protein
MFKLVASPRFTDEGLRHLGATLLLGESQEDLALVAETVKKCVLPTSLICFESRKHVRGWSDTLHIREYSLDVAALQILW